MTLGPRRNPVLTAQPLLLPEVHRAAVGAVGGLGYRGRLAGEDAHTATAPAGVVYRDVNPIPMEGRPEAPTVASLVGVLAALVDVRHPSGARLTITTWSAGPPAALR